MRSRADSCGAESNGELRRLADRLGRCSSTIGSAIGRRFDAGKHFKPNRFRHFEAARRAGSVCRDCRSSGGICGICQIRGLRYRRNRNGRVRIRGVEHLELFGFRGHVRRCWRYPRPNTSLGLDENPVKFSGRQREFQGAFAQLLRLMIRRLSGGRIGRVLIPIENLQARYFYSGRSKILRARRSALRGRAGRAIAECCRPAFPSRRSFHRQ